MRARSRMKRLDDLVNEFSRKFELGKGLRRERALKHWAVAAGEKLARYTRPAGFDRGLLKVIVLHPAASMELGLRKADILKRLNDLAGEILFHEIRSVTPGKRKGVYFDRP